MFSRLLPHYDVFGCVINIKAQLKISCLRYQNKSGSYLNTIIHHCIVVVAQQPQEIQNNVRYIFVWQLYKQLAILFSKFQQRLLANFPIGVVAIFTHNVLPLLKTFLIVFNMLKHVVHRKNMCRFLIFQPTYQTYLKVKPTLVKILNLYPTYFYGFE